MRQKGEVGHSGEEQTKYRHAQVVQCHWDLGVPLAIAASVRGERDCLNKDPISSTYQGLFQPYYIILRITTSLNIFFVMNKSTTMYLHAKLKVKFTLHNILFLTKNKYTYQNPRKWVPAHCGGITGTHLQETPRYWVRTSRRSWGSDFAPLPAWKQKTSSPLENKNCYSN